MRNIIVSVFWALLAVAYSEQYALTQPPKLFGKFNNERNYRYETALAYIITEDGEFGTGVYIVTPAHVLAMAKDHEFIHECILERRQNLKVMVGGQYNTSNPGSPYNVIGINRDKTEFSKGNLAVIALERSINRTMGIFLPNLPNGGYYDNPIRSATITTVVGYDGENKYRKDIFDVIEITYDLQYAVLNGDISTIQVYKSGFMLQEKEIIGVFYNYHQNAPNVTQLGFTNVFAKQRFILWSFVQDGCTMQ